VETGRQQTLNRTVARIPRIYYAFNFFLTATLIRLYYFQVLQL